MGARKVKIKTQHQFLAIILFLFILFTFILSVAASKQGTQKTEWKGEITTENGVKVVKNPPDPLYGKIKLELEEDLSIGREDDENYMFFRVRGIAIDGQQNIYVTDSGNYRIQKFDRSGVYLQTIGRQGQGPGEFEWTMELRIDESTGNIYVKDGPYYIEKFDRKGNHMEAVRLEKSIWSFDLTEDNDFLATQSTTSDTEHTKTLCKVSSKGEIIENYAQYPWQISRQRKGERTTTVISHGVYDLFMANIENQNFVYGYSRDYELNVIDSKGQALYKVKKDESPKNYSAEERKKDKNQSLPPYSPFFYSLITDSKGRIYVQRNRTRGEEFKVNREVDIFSKDGYFLYKSTIPRGTYIIKDGFLYAYVMNEDTGEELVKRYRIKNWKQIKEGM